MADYQNSKSSIDQKMLERKHLNKVVTGNVKVKKKGQRSKFASMIFAEDMENVKKYILQDLIVQNLKTIAIDSFSALLDRKTPHVPTQNGTYFAYNRMTPAAQNMYGKPAGAYAPRVERHDYNTIAFETRGDAEALLFAMNQQISQYRQVSIADMYELVGLDCEFTDYKFGWYDLSQAYPVRTKEGYVLNLPRAVELN